MLKKLKLRGPVLLMWNLGSKFKELGNVERESLQTASDGSRTLLPSPQMKLNKPQNPNPGP